ncbi:MAG: hypothetical protein NTX65_07565 [Ignavibacteriales bacterium]|nr:hypothetical protein [Ignavibacteriales bacterium]
MKKIFVIMILFAFPMIAQDKSESTPSFFDDSELKEFSIKSIIVDGEVENPGAVDLTSLPLHCFPMKDLTYGTDKNKFIGSYFVSGYSLFDIINTKKVKKTNEEEFKPAVDLYVIVENDKGEKTVFSWGELFYSKNNFNAIITKSVSAINPGKMKMKWPLPEVPQIICGYDAFNFRIIANPVRITVKSFVGKYSKERVKETFSPEIKIVNGENNFVITDVIGVETRKFRGIGYGHGRGWKGVDDVEGFVFGSVLQKNVKFDMNECISTILCVSAKDGYRVTYSLSEIINRNDMNDFLLIEKNGSSEDGKFNLFATPDFFVDRNVKSVEKIEFLIIK